MKLVKASCEILDQRESVDPQDIWTQIELAGRTCYKSEDHITPDSAIKFVKMLINSGHGAMLEHGTVYLYDQYDVSAIGSWQSSLAEKYSKNPYSRVHYDDHMDLRGIYITTNYRVLVENNWLDDLKYLCSPSDYHERRITFKFMCDRITGESFLRHRAIDEDHNELEIAVTREMEKDMDSYARESTRYCNYSKAKFGNNIKFVIPTSVMTNFDMDMEYKNGFKSTWKLLKNIFSSKNSNVPLRNKATDLEWLASCITSEKTYFKLLKLGWMPQFARYALSFSILSPLVMTGFVEDWDHFLKLRTAASAHPDAQVLAKEVKRILDARPELHKFKKD